MKSYQQNNLFEKLVLSFSRNYRNGMIIISKYSSFLLFLAKFLGTYGLLVLVYNYYLKQFDTLNFSVDGLTQIVASQTQKTLQFFNYDCQLQPDFIHDTIRLFLNQVSIARIVEGCNGVSVMILFVAFVIAFTGKLKQTLVFILAGILIIHVLNVLRIALLSMALLHYPEYGRFLHGVIFPFFIYGVVFVLWVIWVNKFSLYAAKTEK